MAGARVPEPHPSKLPITGAVNAVLLNLLVDELEGDGLSSSE